jgi:hypothetical protein
MHDKMSESIFVVVDFRLLPVTTMKVAVLLFLWTLARQRFTFD